jgi:hypothetical protein
MKNDEKALQRLNALIEQSLTESQSNEGEETKVRMQFGTQIVRQVKMQTEWKLLELQKTGTSLEQLNDKKTRESLKRTFLVRNDGGRWCLKCLQTTLVSAQWLSDHKISVMFSRTQSMMNCRCPIHRHARILDAGRITCNGRGVRA